MPYLDSLDIGNRALFHLGLPQIASATENSQRNQVISGLYDKVRRPELRRNVWRFSTKRVALRPLTTTSLLLQPEAWRADVLYLVGSIVSDSNGQLWRSNTPDNQANTPGQSGSWDEYFGPVSADAFDSTTAYFSGEVVYLQEGDPGGYVVFSSRTNSNSDTPATTSAWDTTKQYGFDDAVSFGGLQYRSLIAINQGITPVDGPLAWSAGTTYGANQRVTAGDGYIYSSIAGGNLNFDPVTDLGFHWNPTHLPNAWASTPAIFAASNNWLPMFGGLTSQTLTYPIGTGPLSSTLTKNAFRLPAGFLRRAPDDPKAGSVSFLGAPSGNAYDDWIFEGNYIVSREATVIILRFAADVTNVQDMDDMFCEGLAARVALEACETLTQSGEKKNAIQAHYDRIMGEARQVNAIEMSATEPPEDEYIQCRS